MLPTPLQNRHTYVRTILPAVWDLVLYFSTTDSNGTKLKAVWGGIRRSRRSLWNEGLDANKARRADVSIASYRRFESDPQLADFLLHSLELAPFG